MSQIAAEAIALKARFAGLLRGQPSQPADEQCAAIDAARLRLQGKERDEAEQMSLDLTSRQS